MTFSFDPSDIAQSILEDMPNSIVKTDLAVDPERLMAIFDAALLSLEEGMQNTDENSAALRRRGLDGLEALAYLRSLGVVV